MKLLRNWHPGRWFAGPRLVITSVSAAVILVLIIVGAVWLASPRSNESLANSNAPSLGLRHGPGLDGQSGGAMPPVAGTTMIVPATTVTMPELAPAPSPDMKSGSGAYYGTSVPSPAGGPPAGSPPDASISGGIDVTQQVIYNGNISITVNTVSTAVSQVQSIAQGAGGKVESMSSFGGQAQQQASITIRVPSDQFFTVMDKLKDLGTVQDQNVSSQDVTQQFIDLQARLKTAQVEEQSLLSLLDKAQTITDIITIQTQLTQVRAQIESLQGQLNYIQNRVDMAAITVNLSTTTKNVGQPPSASLTVGTSNVSGSAASVKQLVTASKGFIDSDSISINNGNESAYIQMRVFRSDFDQILAAIERQGKVEQKTVQEAVNAAVDQSAPDNAPPDAVITLSLIEVSGFWTGTTVAVISIAGGVVIVALLVFLGLAWRAGLLKGNKDKGKLET